MTFSKRLILKPFILSKFVTVLGHTTAAGRLVSLYTISLGWMQSRIFRKIGIASRLVCGFGLHARIFGHAEVRPCLSGRASHGRSEIVYQFIPFHLSFTGWRHWRENIGRVAFFTSGMCWMLPYCSTTRLHVQGVFKVVLFILCLWQGRHPPESVTAGGRQ